MRLLQATVPNDCDIVLMGDDHKGAKASHSKGVDSVFEWIMGQPNRYFCHMGDEIEARTIDHHYFDIDTTDTKLTKPMLQIEAAIKQYRPVKDRCLAWLYGNHSAALDRFGNLTKYLCDQLNIPYGGVMCKLRLVNKRNRQIAKFFLYHPFRFTLRHQAKDYDQRLANKKARLKDFLYPWAADCLLMAIGHVHQLIVASPVRTLLMTDDGKHLQQEYLAAGKGDSDYIEKDRRWYCCAGSFLKSSLMNADTYSEKHGYPPTEMGYCIAEIRKGQLVNVKEVVI